MRIDELARLAAVLRATTSDVLLDLLERNAATEFGRRYQFATISDAAEFKRRVPLATYDSFFEDLKRIEHGERGILSTNRVSGMTRTSGTTGAAKVFPRSDMVD